MFVDLKGEMSCDYGVGGGVRGGGGGGGIWEYASLPPLLPLDQVHSQRLLCHHVCFFPLGLPPARYKFPIYNFPTEVLILSSMVYIIPNPCICDSLSPQGGKPQLHWVFTFPSIIFCLVEPRSLKNYNSHREHRTL